MRSSEQIERPNKIAALSPAKRVLVLGTVLLVLFLILLLIAEIAVRTRMYFKYGTFAGFEITADDPATGLNLPEPNYESGPLKINSLGFRSPELVQPRPEDTLRLAFLGGSTTYCQEVSSIDMVWSDIVTRGLQNNFPEQRFDYINASATALTVSDSLINLKVRVAKHAPDVIVIYHAVNDLAINAERVAREQGLAYSNQPRSPWLSKLMRVSLLADLVYKNVLILVKKREQSDTARKIVVDAKVMHKLSEQFRNALQALVDEALTVSELVVIPTFANHLRKGQSLEQRQVAISTHVFHFPFMVMDDLLVALESYNQVIRDFASNENVLVLETESVIRGIPENFFDSVHFTDKGSSILGQYLTNELSQAPEFQALMSRGN